MIKIRLTFNAKRFYVVFGVLFYPLKQYLYIYAQNNEF